MISTPNLGSGARGRSDASVAFQALKCVQPALLTDGSLPSPERGLSNLLVRFPFSESKGLPVHSAPPRHSWSKKLKPFHSVMVLMAALSLPVAPPSLAASADGYVFREKEFNRPVMRIVTHEVGSRLDLIALARELNVPLENPRRVAAFSILSKDPADIVCHIYHIDQAVQYQPEFLGHELAHCKYGRWHQ